jgi:RHS repeat-associated protein
LLTGGIDQLFTRADSSGTVSSLTDAQGSVIALTDSSGAIQTQYSYEPFGSTSSSGGANSNAQKYSGREDDGTGLYYYRNRYYSPLMQRFISEDPIGLAGGINLYAYVHNNPISFRDPSGLQAENYYLDLDSAPPLGGRASHDDFNWWGHFFSDFMHRDMRWWDTDPHRPADGVGDMPLVMCGPAAYSAGLGTVAPPPNEALGDLMNGRGPVDGWDCSETAEFLFKNSKVGFVFRVEPANSGNLTIMENGGWQSGFSYHEAYTDGYYVYDPRIWLKPYASLSLGTSHAQTKPRSKDHQVLTSIRESYDTCYWKRSTRSPRIVRGD